MKYKISLQDIFPDTMNESIATAVPSNKSKITKITKTTDGSYILEWDTEPDQTTLDHVHSILEKRVIRKTEKMKE
jgi:hypothetical protein